MKITYKNIPLAAILLAFGLSSSGIQSAHAPLTTEEMAAKVEEILAYVQTATKDQLNDPAMKTKIQNTLKMLNNTEVAKLLAQNTASSYNMLKKQAVTSFQKNIQGSIATIMRDKKRTMQKIKKEEQMAYEKAWKIVVKDTFCTPLDIVMDQKTNPNGSDEMLSYLNSMDKSDRSDVRALCGINAYSSRVGNKDVATFTWAQ